MILQDLLLKSCVEMNNISKAYCEKDFMDSDESCSWYHSVWQYLRALDCVSAPQWHEEFYSAAFADAFKRIAENSDTIRILISGTADYSMLHTVLTALSLTDLKADVDIIDKCPTPLKICEWYVDKCKKSYKPKFFKDQVIINYIKRDLLYYNVSSGKQYDLICADAFLTRFSDDDVSAVLKKWWEILKPLGRVITTVRIHNDNSKQTLYEFTALVNSFLNKVKMRYSKLTAQGKSLKICDGEVRDVTEDEIMFFAYRYFIKMVSNFIGNKTRIENHFFDIGFSINENLSSVSKVEGEAAETSYYQITAVKNVNR